MKITKFVHSCLLVEIEDQTILFDPGEFSWEAGVFAIQKLKVLDTVVITHEHPDHFHPDFVRAIFGKFPDASFVSTQSVVAELRQLGVRHASTEAVDPLRIFSKAKHASNVPLDPAIADNIALHVADRLTVGGDRHDLEETKDILAFSMTAPWGSTRDAARMVLRLKPKMAIPIHDWHWNEEARRREYARYERILGEQGITFIRPIDGHSFEV